MVCSRRFVAVGFALVAAIASASCATTTSQPSSSDSGAGGSTNAPDSGGPTTQVEAGLTFDGALLNPLCGNGTVDPGEQCDDGDKINGNGCDDTCLFSCTHGVDDDVCADGNYCNGAETCGPDHECVPSTGPLPDGTICGEANKCTGGKCTVAAPDCGDTLVEPPEECDNGPSGDSASCIGCRFTCLSTDPTRDCTSSDPCGGQGTCDDGTHLCSSGTRLKDLTSCGDGKACVSGVCTDKYCSNGKVDPGEECDDGNLSAGDGCEPNCKFTCLSSDKTRNCSSSGGCSTCSATTHVCLPVASGTACGTGDDCVAGNCDKPICGDGIVAAGVEDCDDGNAIDGDGCNHDCKFSCSAATAAADCAGKTPSCRTATCTNHLCTSSANDGANGSACTFGGSTSSACGGGNCGTCGNGNTDSGEQCDDGNAVSGDGCEPNCTFSCSKNADCDDGDACDGAETCDTGAHQCKAGTSEADGAACGTGKVCISASCRPSFCGDGYTDAAKGEQCDPPNTAGCDSTCKAITLCNLQGDWALKLTESVSWGDDQVLDVGTGQILQWAKLTITPKGTTFTASLRACGLTIPDFHTATALGSEWYGTTFENTLFDKPTMPTFSLTGTLGNLAPGASVEIGETAILLGVTIPTPPGPFITWPSDPTDLIPANGFTLVDQDGDKAVGITAVAKKGQIPAGSPGAGASYQDPIEDLTNGLANPGRADQLDIALRQITSQSGTLNSCTSMSGTATAVIDNHIVGCHVDTGGTCSSLNLVDGARPLYAVSSAAFKSIKITDGSDCTAVRTALP